MAAGKINLQKASGGITAITGVDGASNTNLVLPESGNVASVDAAVTDNAIARYDSTTGKLQNSAITIDDSGNIGSGTQSFNGFGGSGFKNHIINGNFKVDQRNGFAEFTIPAGMSQFTADRWMINNTTNQSVTIRVADFPTNDGGLTGRLRIKFNTAPTTGVIQVSQKIEDVRLLGGKTITVSEQLSGDSMSVSSDITQAFGTSGSASVVIPLGVIGTLSNALNLTKYSSSVSLPSIEGKTIGYNSYTQLTYNLPIRTTNIQTICFVQLEEGSVATPFENRPYGLELSLCQRYYEFIQLNMNTYQLNGAAFGYSAPFRAIKRVPPTISVSSVAYSNATTIDATGTNMASINAIATATATGSCSFAVAFIANAEL